MKATRHPVVLMLAVLLAGRGAVGLGAEDAAPAQPKPIAPVSDADVVGLAPSSANTPPPAASAPADSSSNSSPAAGSAQSAGSRSGMRNSGMSVGRRGGRGSTGGRRGSSAPADDAAAAPVDKTPPKPVTPTAAKPAVPPEWKKFDLNGDGVLDKHERALMEQHQKEYQELAIPPAGTTPAPAAAKDAKQTPGQMAAPANAAPGTK